jgi:hypothetical protein
VCLLEQLFSARSCLIVLYEVSHDGLLNNETTALLCRLPFNNFEPPQYLDGTLRKFSLPSADYKQHCLQKAVTSWTGLLIKRQEEKTEKKKVTDVFRSIGLQRAFAFQTTSRASPITLYPETAGEN